MTDLMTATTTHRAGLFPSVLLTAGSGSATALATHLTGRGYSLVDDASAADVVVITADQPVPALDKDAGLVVLLTGAASASVENLLAESGISFTAAERPASAWVLPDPESVPAIDFRTGLGDHSLPSYADITVAAPATATLSRAGTNGRPAQVTAATAVTAGGNRLFVATCDVTAEDVAAATTVLFNGITWAARPARAVEHRTGSSTGDHPSWLALKAAAEQLQALQIRDGSVPEAENHAAATALIATITTSITELAPLFPHDAAYLSALVVDFDRWVNEGLGVPDFLDSLMAFQPQLDRVDGIEHLVVFPMYTQNGSTNRFVEAVLLAVVWPEFIGELQAGDYSNKLFLPVRFIDFTAGYNTNSAVLFPESVAMREVPSFTWGAIFADREAARFQRVVKAAAETTRLALPPDAARLLDDPTLATETFVMWDLIHDRTHMHGDLPFDPFMVKQRMPFFLYSLEELRCDLTAFRESVKLEAEGIGHARLVQYAVIFDRIFRFSITGSRVRNYDGLGGQLLFAWLHQHHVLHWTDNRLHIEWDKVTEAVLALGREIDDLYWRSIDRPKTSHWLAAYELVSRTVTPNPASVWAKGPAALPLDGPPKGLTDAVLNDEFPLSMFFEALSKKMGDVITSTAGIRL